MADDPTRSVTQLLGRYTEGDLEDGEELLLAIYEELKRMAEGQMRRESPGHTLQATALVHELWGKLASIESKPAWPSRGHFFKWASKAMGNILRDYARHKNSQKAGGNHLRVTLEGSELAPHGDSTTGLLDTLDAIEELSSFDDKLGGIVELRVFGGLSYVEIAETLSLSESQVDRSLQAARAWLRVRLEP